MGTVYAVRNWDKHYEVAQSRKIRGPLPWVSLPTKHDGKGYRRIVALEDSAELLGCWMLIIEVAAKCSTRGVLADHDGPLSAEDLSFKTGVPTASFTRALEVFARPSVGWLYAKESGESGSTVDDAPYTGQNRTGQDRTEPESDPDAHEGPTKASEPAPSAPPTPPSDPNPKSGFFKDVTEEMLRSEAETDAWFQAGIRFGKLTSPHHRHQVHAMAVHALRIGKTPVKVFVRNVKAGDFKAITNVDADEATDRIGRIDSPEPGAVAKAIGQKPTLKAPPAADNPGEAERRDASIRLLRKQVAEEAAAKR